MTKKKTNHSDFDEWINELEAVIRHEILFHIVETKILKDGDFFFNSLPFITIQSEMMSAAWSYLERLLDIGDDLELVDIITQTGSLEGLHAAERFLDESDFLIQVVEKEDIQELNEEAKYCLSNKYTMATKTIAFLMKETGYNELPACIKSQKLTEHFSVQNLWQDNNLEEIIAYHQFKLGLNTTKNGTLPIPKKPELITSNKKYEYIDLTIKEVKGEIDINASFKLSKIAKLDKEYQSEILKYCENFVGYQLKKHLLRHEITLSVPIPPCEKKIASKIDSYFGLILGLYCIKNESKYKTLDYIDYNQTHTNLEDFLLNDVYPKFSDFLQPQFFEWCDKNGFDKQDKGNLTSYIKETFVKRIKYSIKQVESLINVYELNYFT